MTQCTRVRVTPDSPWEDGLLFGFQEIAPFHSTTEAEVREVFSRSEKYRHGGDHVRILPVSDMDILTTCMGRRIIMKIQVTEILTRDMNNHTPPPTLPYFTGTVRGQRWLVCSGFVLCFSNPVTRFM